VHFTRSGRSGFEFFLRDAVGLQPGKRHQRWKIDLFWHTDHELAFEITFARIPRKAIASFCRLLAHRLRELGGHPGMNDQGLAYVIHGATIGSNQAAKYLDRRVWAKELRSFITLRFARMRMKPRKCSYPTRAGMVLRADLGGCSGNAWVIESRENPRASGKAATTGD